MLDHRCHNLDRHFSILLDLVFQAEDGALAQPLPIKVLEDLWVLVLLHRLSELHQCLLPKIAVVFGEHIQETVVALFELRIRRGLYNLVLHVSGLR